MMRPLFALLLAGTQVAALPGAPMPILEDPLHPDPALMVPEGYRDLQNITDLLRSYSVQFPDRAMLVDITDEYNNGRKTAEGRGIYALKVSDNVQENEDEPNVLMTGCLHAQELQTPEAILMMAEVLLLASDTDSDGNTKDASASLLSSKYHLKGREVAKLRNAVATTQVWLIAVIVSDGYQFVFDDTPSWRKNRTPNPGGSFGIDLNRNFKQGWYSECSGSTNPASNTFKGPFPNSEAETEALIEMAKVLRFEKLMDFHSTGREVLANYRCTPYPELLDDWMREKAIALGVFADYVYRQPSAEGEFFTHYINNFTSYSFLTEMGAQHRPPFEVALEECLRVLPMLVEFLADPVTVFGHVTDAATGVPLPARIERMEFEDEFVDGETRFAEATHGRFSEWLPNGLWTLRFSMEEHEGIRYAPATVQVEVVNGETRELNIELLEEEQH